jgi:hypothetical protein
VDMTEHETNEALARACIQSDRAVQQVAALAAEVQTLKTEIRELKSALKNGNPGAMRRAIGVRF